MSTDYAAAVQGLNQDAAGLYKGAPEVMKAFQALEKSAHGGEALDHATKELIAVAISIAIRCEDCIAYHMRAAARHGASREAALEAIGVAVQLGGGPGVVYGAKALAAYDQFAGTGGG
jgi:AhpD family alkylhydroperoxidase